MAEMPEQHIGIAYTDFVASLSQKRAFRRYFEVGVNEGRLMSFVHADVAVGVDPQFVLTHNAAAHKGRTHLIRTTSDQFFASPDLVFHLGGAPDFSFLDGYHTFEYLLRDFMNTEALGGRASIIAMHDCLPLDDVMTIRSLPLWRTRSIGTKYQGSWTGDVWKVIPILKKYRPDLKVLLVDCPPTGVVCVTQLDPKSTVLHERYLEIVEQFRSIPNNMEEIKGLWDSSTLVSSRDILNEQDHSLYFVT